MTQIFIYPRSFLCLADVGLFVRPKSQQPPSNKESQFNFLYKRRLNTWSRSNSLLHGQITSYVKHQMQSATPLYRVGDGTPLQRNTNVKYLVSSIIALQEPNCTILPQIERSTTSNITHTHDKVRGMALIPIEGLGASSQKTSLLGGVAQILIYPRPSSCLADVGLFVRSKSQQKY